MTTSSRNFWRAPFLLLAAGFLATFGAVAGLIGLVNRDLAQQSRLINVSARGPAGNGADALLIAFVIDERPQKVVVRAMGPSLAKPGGPAALSRVRLRIVRHADGVDVGRNDAWRAAGNEALLNELKHLAPSHAQDAACVVTLQPGSYSALVEPFAAERGVAAIELFVIRH